MNLPRYLYLDIETLPTEDPATIDRIAETITPPKTLKKPESIAAWMADEKASAVAEAVHKTGLNGAKGRVLCIGHAFDGGLAHVICEPTEAETLAAFVGVLTENGNMSLPAIVGHNVINFDLRFIVQRCIVNGVVLPRDFPRDPKPWGNEVDDTMTMWAGARGTISLDDLCFALGVPGKADIDGSMVAQLYRDGELNKILEYCADDVERTRAVHRRMLKTFGKAA
jgi:hypothetical protein